MHYHYGRGYFAAIIIAIAIILFIVFAIGMFAYLIYYYLLCGILAPTKKVMAKVVYKHVRMEGPDHFLVFEYNGKKQEFCVPASTYIATEIGDYGLLIHKGMLFRDFVIRSQVTR